MKNNKKGFTLVELLAVIIVLALILVLIVPTVLSTMNDAKRKTFSMYGQRVLTNAQTVYQAYTLMTDGNTDLEKLGVADNAKLYCININKLGLKNMGTYSGFVIINGLGDVADYKIYLTDGNNYVYNGVGPSEIDTASAHLKEGTSIGPSSTISVTFGDNSYTVNIPAACYNSFQ